jgi:hypothetical protein
VEFFLSIHHKECFRAIIFSFSSASCSYTEKTPNPGDIDERYPTSQYYNAYHRMGERKWGKEKKKKKFNWKSEKNVGERE